MFSVEVSQLLVVFQGLGLFFAELIPAKAVALALIVVLAERILRGR